MKQIHPLNLTTAIAVALLTTVLVATSTFAQRGGDRNNTDRNKANRHATSNSRHDRTADVNRTHHPAPTKTSSTVHDKHNQHGHRDHPHHGDHRSHASHTRHTPHIDRGRHHRGHIRFDLGRHEPHTVSRKIWVPGRYETRTERVLVQAGHYDTKVIPARYEWRRHHDHWDRVCVEPERTVKVWHPAEYENRTVKVWVPGYYKTVQSTRCHRTRPSISIGGIFRF